MPLKVIGAGFGRTGTMSLKAALELLGLNPCYHMIECFPKGPPHWQLWVDAAAGRPDWDTLYEGFEAAVDFPTCSFYRPLAEHYPDAKVVLTVRDPERWYQSTQQTIFGSEWMEFLKNSELWPFMKATINDLFQNRMHDRDHLIQRFEAHIEEVRNTIEPSRLLVFDVKQGWGPLCEFLQVDEPAEAFPHVNDTAATQDIIASVMRGELG